MSQTSNFSLFHLEKNVEYPVVAHISTYPPRECGIAVYTKDLVESLVFSRFTHIVLALDYNKPRYKYSCPVSFIINAVSPSDYTDAAEFLNKSPTSVVSLQHEYGIFGGDWGRYILRLSTSLEKPLITTFHTVLRRPPPLAKEILTELASASKYVIVTLRKAARLITNVYDVPQSKVRVIQHGAPLVGQRDPSAEKIQLGLSGRWIISTVGFVSPAKSIEYGIRALRTLVKEYPNIIYIVVGETHPVLKQYEGEAYRKKLEDLVRDLALTQHVTFVNRFVSEDELAMYLNVADVYIAPHVSRDQVSSGSLTRAIASGKAIVASPTPFAKETLSPKRALFCEFDDAKSIARQVHRILSNPSLKQRLESRAKQYGRRIGWQQAAEKYAKLFNRALED